MKYFLTFFLLTISFSLNAQDPLFLENAVPTNGLIDSGNYQTTINNYLNPNKVYYEGVAANASKFLNGTTSVSACDNLNTNEEKAICYEKLANNQLYNLQTYLKEALDASNDSSLNIGNNYISNVINEVFSNVVDIEGTFTPEIINNVGSIKKSFYANGQEINTQISYADINGDGYDDFVTRYMENGQTKIITRLSYGDGSLFAHGDEKETFTNDGIETYYQTLGSITRNNPFYLHDVNNDDNADIIYVYHDNNGLKTRVRLSLGNGEFSSVPTDSQFTDGFGVLAQSINGLNVEHNIRFIDMNNDDELDLVYVFYSGGLKLRVRHGFGDGTFSGSLNQNHTFADGNGVMVQDIGVQKISHKMNILDINNDNYPDLAYVNSDDGNLRIRVRLSNGSGGFQTLEQDTFDDGTIVFGQNLGGQFIPHNFYFSDVNNDEFPDLIYGHHNNGLKIRVKLSNGDGTFYNTPQQNFPDGVGSFIQNIDGVIIKNKIQITDVNDDNNGDFVYRIKSSVGTEVRVRLSNLDGTFTHTPVRNIINFNNVSNPNNITDYSFPLALADLNDNNKLDIINLAPNRILTNLNRVGTMPYMPYKKITNASQFSNNKLINEEELSLSQFMYLVSRYLNITGETGNKAKILEGYLNKWILEYPQRSLYGWNNRRTYYTHKTLMKYQESQDIAPNPLIFPSGEPFPSHASAIRDVDLWIMASLVEYLSYNEGLVISDDNKLDIEKINRYKNYLNQALGFVKSRITEEPIGNVGGPIGIKFDIGKWKDHPDSKYGYYTGILNTNSNNMYELPAGADIGNVDSISYDFAHAYRLVDVFESFKRNNTLSDISELGYFNESFMEKLANQVVYSLYHPQVLSLGTVPRFKNYFDGDYNGWYRVNYLNRPNYGFEPFQKSGAFIAGGFARLGKYNSDLAELSVDIWNYRQSSIGDDFIDYNYNKFFVPDTFDRTLNSQIIRPNVINDIRFFSAIASYGANYLYKETSNGPTKIYIVDPNSQNRNNNGLNDINVSTTYKEIKVYNMYGGFVKVYNNKKIIDLKNEFSGLYIIKTISKEDTKTGKFMF